MSKYFISFYLALGFPADPAQVLGHKINITVEGLAKLFFFGRYVNAKALQKNTTAKEVIEEEIRKYPYRTKKDFQVMKSCIFFLLNFNVSNFQYPTFLPLDFNEENPFHASLTDSGLCQVLNGASMRQTYNHDNEGVDELARLLDPRGEVEPMRIPALPGRVVKRSFLLYIGDRSRIQ